MEIIVMPYTLDDPHISDSIDVSCCLPYCIVGVTQLKVGFWTVFLSRASACTIAGRARYCFTISVRPSVSPSVRHVAILHLNKCTYRSDFLTLW